MRLFQVVAFLLIAHNLFATNATEMHCSGARGSSFIFHIEPETNGVRVASFFDGNTVWLPRSVTVDGNQYTMQMFRPESAGSGEIVTKDVMERMSFTLPANREVTRVQTGGYYIPEYTYYPAKFNLRMNTQTASGEALPTIHVSCTGY